METETLKIFNVIFLVGMAVVILVSINDTHRRVMEGYERGRKSKKKHL